jgi:hypothetical protein
MKEKFATTPGTLAHLIGKLKYLRHEDNLVNEFTTSAMRAMLWDAKIA